MRTLTLKNVPSELYKSLKHQPELNHRSINREENYNNVRLNSAVGYITPRNVLAGRQAEIHAQQDRKLVEARKQRQVRRQKAA